MRGGPVILCVLMLCVILGSFGCAGGAMPRAAKVARAVAAPSTKASADPAAALAARLPVAADRCVVARLEGIEPARLAQLGRVLQSDALAWDAQLELIAIASAERARDDGPSAQVLLLRSRLAPEVLRERLNTRLAIDWDHSFVCASTPCPMRGSQLQDGTTLLERSEWPVGSAPGAEARCRGFGTAEHEQVIELQASRVPRMPTGDLFSVPMRTTTSARIDDDGVRIERSELMAGRDDAALRVEQLRAEPTRGASDLRVEQEDTLVRMQMRYLWTELELRVDDEARLAAAELAARARVAMPAPELAAGLPPSAYLSRAAHLLFGMHDLRSTERTAQREALSALLEQAVATYPEHEPLAALLFDLRLSDPARVSSALQLAERFAALPGTDPRWAVRARTAREALAKPRP